MSIEVSGKTVVVTGNFPGHTQKALKERLTALGARVVASVSGKTDLVFSGGDGNANQRKAEALRLPIHSAKELFALFESSAAKPKAAAKTKPKAAAKPKNASKPKNAAKPKAAAKPKTAEPASEFAGLTIAVTGKFVTMKRADASALLSAAGASVGGSVTKKTDLLIYGEKAGSKLSKARTLGIRLLTEAEFIAVLDRSSVKSELLEGASDKVAEAEEAERKKMAAARKTIDSVLDVQRERWGVTLGSLLLKYIHVLGQRPDVYVYKTQIGGPSSNASLLAHHKRVPKAWLALASEVNDLEFNWVLTEHKADRAQFSEGYNGGRIKLVGLPSPGYRLWYAIPEWRKEYDDYEAEASFDDFVAEGRTVYSYDPGRSPTQATLIFDNANDCERHPLGSLESYFLNGARAAFSWYWQVGGEGEFTETLLGRSIPRTTDPQVIVGLLQDKGLSEPEARGMVAWLGEDVVILLHSSELPDGGELSKPSEESSVFPGLGESSERGMDHGLIRSLTASADAMSDEEWAETLDKHASFLAAGGAGGSWTPLSAGGLPMCIYHGKEVADGEQAVFRLKRLDGRDASEVDLSWSDLSGASFVGARFAEANLAQSMAMDSVMDECDFSGANLSGADFSGTSLRGANFRKANLSGADMEATDLTGADFTGAILEGARFPGAILDGVVHEDL